MCIRDRYSAAICPRRWCTGMSGFCAERARPFAKFRPTSTAPRLSLIHIFWQNGQYKATRDIGEVRASFEDTLRRLETDYIDVGMIHYVDTMDTWNTVANGEVMRYALEMCIRDSLRSAAVRR